MKKFLNKGRFLKLSEMNRPLTVLLLISSLPAHGAEQLLLDILENSDHTEFRFLVCAVAGGGPMVEEIRRIGIPVTVFEKRFKFDLSILWKIWRLIRQEKVDIVHTHLFTADAWGRFAAILAGVRVIIRTAHNSDTWKRWSHRLADRLLLKGTDKIIAVSESVGHYLVNTEKVDPKKIIIIKNGINLKRFEKVDIDEKFKISLGIKPLERVVGIIGRLEPVKGHEVFLEAAQKLVSKQSKIRFLIVGDGSLQSDLEKKSKILGLENFVIFTGMRRDIPSILKSLDCFVLSSHREGLPMVVLEAMAAGVPVVATAVGGIPEVITDRIHGLIVPPGNLGMLADAMEWLLTHPAEAGYLGKAAHKKVLQEFNIAKTSNQIESVYKEITSLEPDLMSEKPSVIRRAASSWISSGLYPIYGLKTVLQGQVPRIRILAYHRVAQVHGYDYLAVSPDHFEEQMRFLAKKKITVLSLCEAIDQLEKGGSLPPKTVVITFDDGYKDNYTIAYPILKRFGFKATIFLVPGFINNSVKLPRYENAGNNLFLQWNEIKEMMKDGFSFGAHSCQHINLTQLSSDAARNEILLSKRIIEDQLGQPVAFFSYPRGDFKPEHKKMVEEAGYRSACSTRPGSNTSETDKFALCRTEISPKDTLWDFEKKIAGAYDLLHAAWQWKRVQFPG